jgi:hypothetical protein
MGMFKRELRIVDLNEREDRPAHDGKYKRLVLSALSEARTVSEVALYLQWDWDRAHSWVHHLKRSGEAVPVATTITAAGRRAYKYLRVTQGHLYGLPARCRCQSKVSRPIRGD